jgi:Flp pilus assembly protein TadG
MYSTRKVRGCARARSTVKRKSRRGAAAVEMGFVLPIFLMVIFGIIEFGRAFSAQHLLDSAARLGARRSIVDGATNVDVEQRVKDYCTGVLGVSQNAVTVTLGLETEDGGAVAGNNLAHSESGGMCSVTVNVPFSAISILGSSYLTGASLSSHYRPQFRQSDTEPRELQDLSHGIRREDHQRFHCPGGYLRSQHPCKDWWTSGLLWSGPWQRTEAEYPRWGAL